MMRTSHVARYALGNRLRNMQHAQAEKSIRQGEVLHLCTNKQGVCMEWVPRLQIRRITSSLVTPTALYPVLRLPEISTFHTLHLILILHMLMGVRIALSPANHKLGIQTSAAKWGDRTSSA